MPRKNRRTNRKTNRRRINQVKSHKRKTRGGKVSRRFKGYRGGSDSAAAAFAAQARRRAMMSSTGFAELKTFFNIQEGDVAGHTLEGLRIREKHIHDTLSEVSLQYVNLIDRRDLPKTDPSRSSVDDIVTQVSRFITSYDGELDDNKFSPSKFPLYSVQKELVLLGEMPKPFNLRELYVTAAIDTVELAMEAGVESDFVSYIETMKRLNLLTFTETSLTFGAASQILQTLATTSQEAEERLAAMRKAEYIDPILAHISEVLELIGPSPTFKRELIAALKKLLSQPSS